MPVRELVEVFDSVSPSVCKLNAEDGSYTRTYVIEKPPPSAQDIRDTLAWLVGWTEVGVSPTNPGRLTRHLPQADPCFTSWLVRGVTNVRGVGQSAKTNADNAFGTNGAMPIPFTLTYDQLFVTVEFGPRYAPVLIDYAIPQVLQNPENAEELVWYLSDGTVKPFFYYPEWWRMCQWSPKPQNNYASTANAQMKLLGINGYDVGKGPPFTGDRRVYLPDDIVEMSWNMVPRRYVDSPNSFLSKLQGTVNQYGFWESQSDRSKMVFPAGSLQYLTFEPQDFSSADQAAVKWNPDVSSTGKLVNLKLIFQRTRRQAINPPNVAVQNYQRCRHGWNAQPWLALIDANGQPIAKGKGFYYATSNVDGVNGAPSWVSAPHQLLFLDPDAPVPGVPQVPDVL